MKPLHTTLGREARPAPSASCEAPAPSDEMLMTSFLGGDSGAFDLLFERYRQRIYLYLRRLAGATAAEDLTQTTFLSVVRGRDCFARGARFRPWLYAIATNAARDHLRRRRFEQLSADGELPLPGSDGT